MSKTNNIINSNVFKWLALGCASIYIYRLYKENKLLSGNPKKVMGYISPWLNLNPIAKAMVNNLGENFLSKIMMDDENQAIDADYRRV